jgi:hypothetical protein
VQARGVRGGPGAIGDQPSHRWRGPCVPALLRGQPGRLVRGRTRVLGDGRDGGDERHGHGREEWSEPVHPVNIGPPAPTLDAGLFRRNRGFTSFSREPNGGIIGE